jgi:hypothetical protein
MVLRDAAGHVVDSLNYGDLVDPWASGGLRGAAGKAATCHADAPGVPAARAWDRPLPGIPFSGAVAQVDPTQGSTGRYPDGQDSDNDCTDFVTAASIRTGGAAAGATRVSVATTGHLAPGQTVVLDAGADAETLTVATVGSSGITRASAPADKGATVVRVDDPHPFAVGQAIVVGSGADEETAVVAAVDTTWRAGKLTLKAPLARAHDAGASVAGTGIAFTGPMAKAHSAGTVMTATGDLATPGAPNRHVRPAAGSESAH